MAAGLRDVVLVVVFFAWCVEGEKKKMTAAPT